jgi:hypothetical protein
MRAASESDDIVRFRNESLRRRLRVKGVNDPFKPDKSR